jgi:hypothetical protein
MKSNLSVELNVLVQAKNEIPDPYKPPPAFVGICGLLVKRGMLAPNRTRGGFDLTPSGLAKADTAPPPIKGRAKRK